MGPKRASSRAKSEEAQAAPAPTRSSRRIRARSKDPDEVALTESPLRELPVSTRRSNRVSKPTSKAKLNSKPSATSRQPPTIPEADEEGESAEPDHQSAQSTQEQTQPSQENIDSNVASFESRESENQINLTQQSQEEFHDPDQEMHDSTTSANNQNAVEQQQSFSSDSAVQDQTSPALVPSYIHDAVTSDDTIEQSIEIPGPVPVSNLHNDLVTPSSNNLVTESDETTEQSANEKAKADYIYTSEHTPDPSKTSEVHAVRNLAVNLFVRQERATKQVQLLQIQLRERDEECARLEARYRHAQGRQDQLEIENRSLVDQVTQLNTQLNSSVEKSDVKIRELNDENNLLVDKLSEAEEVVTGREDQVRVLVDENAELEDLRDTILQQYNRLEDHRSDLQRQLDVAKLRIAALESRLRAPNHPTIRTNIHHEANLAAQDFQGVTENSLKRARDFDKDFLPTESDSDHDDQERPRQRVRLSNESKPQTPFTQHSVRRRPHAKSSRNSQVRFSMMPPLDQEAPRFPSLRPTSFSTFTPRAKSVQFSMSGALPARSTTQQLFEKQSQRTEQSSPQTPTSRTFRNIVSTGLATVRKIFSHTSSEDSASRKGSEAIPGAFVEQNEADESEQKPLSASGVRIPTAVNPDQQQTNDDSRHLSDMNLSHARIRAFMDSRYPLPKDSSSLMTQEEKAQKPGAKRARPPSPETIPNPAGVSYGMDVNYFIVSPGSEDPSEVQFDFSELEDDPGVQRNKQMDTSDTSMPDVSPLSNKGKIISANRSDDNDDNDERRPATKRQRISEGELELASTPSRTKTLDHTQRTKTKQTPVSYPSSSISRRLPASLKYNIFAMAAQQEAENEAKKARVANEESPTSAMNYGKDHGVWTGPKGQGQFTVPEPSDSEESDEEEHDENPALTNESTPPALSTAAPPATIQKPIQTNESVPATTIKSTTSTAPAASIESTSQNSAQTTSVFKAVTTPTTSAASATFNANPAAMLPAPPVPFEQANETEASELSTAPPSFSMATASYSAPGPNAQGPVDSAALARLRSQAEKYKPKNPSSLRAFEAMSSPLAQSEKEQKEKKNKRGKGLSEVSREVGSSDWNTSEPPASEHADTTSKSVLAADQKDEESWSRAVSEHYAKLAEATNILKLLATVSDVPEDIIAAFDPEAAPVFEPDPSWPSPESPPNISSPTTRPRRNVPSESPGGTPMVAKATGYWDETLFDQLYDTDFSLTAPTSSSGDESLDAHLEADRDAHVASE